MVAPHDSSDDRRPVSPRKRRANRRNAQQSTGPRTPQGKARSSRNATTHGIFCRDLVLAGEDAELFDMTRDGFIDALKPQDAAQLALVDTAVGARWRLSRCQFAEAVLIERRIAAATARVKDGFDSLKQRMSFDDFSTAAIDAQCAASERFRAHYQKYRDLRAAQTDALRPGHALALLMYSNRDGDLPLDRLSRYEHRLEGSFHRCLRDLHVLKKLAKAYADEPPSPFRTRRVEVDEDESAPAGRGVDQRGCGDRRPPSPLAGERGGEGDARGVGAARSAESSSVHLRNRPSQLHTVPPHPNPLPRGERGPETNAHVQNEPTADATAASADAAGGSDARGEKSASIDPREMAELRRFSSLLDRARPSQHDADPDDTLPPDWE